MRRRLHVQLSASIVTFVWTILYFPGRVANYEVMTDDVAINEVDIRENAYNLLMARSLIVDHEGNSNRNIIVKKRATATVANNETYAELEDAAKKNDLKQFQWIVNEKKPCPARDWFGPLAHIAANERSLDVLRYIVELQAWTLENRNEDRDMLVHVAAKKGHLDAIRLIMHEKPSVLKRTSGDGETIAHIAARLGYVDIVHYLIDEASPIIGKKDREGRTVLHLGVENDSFDTQTVEKIHRRGVSLVSISNDGETLATIAARKGNLDLLQFLSRKKPSSVLRVTDDGQTIAHIAAENGHANIVRYMAEKSEQLAKQKDNAGNTVAQIAAKRGYVDVIEALTEKIPSFLEDFGENIAQIALENGHLGIIKFVVQHYPPLLTKFSHNGQTILHRAVHSNLTDWEALRKEDISMPVASSQSNMSSNSETRNNDTVAKEES